MTTQNPSSNLACQSGPKVGLPNWQDSLAKSAS